MPTRKSTLAEIRYLLDLQRHAEERLATLSPDVFRDETLYKKNRGKLQQRIDSNRRDLEEALESYALFPQRHYDRHSQGLNARFSSGAFESNVFIMTRFPAAGKAGAERLNEVIDRVKTAVADRGYMPRMASHAVHHAWLWDNVELNMLGSKYGVAILEDQCQPELNPNVAMEWGWMLGMGREVLMLREKHFGHLRADWAGRLDKTFAWDDPGSGIEQAVVEFLPPRGGG